MNKARVKKALIGLVVLLVAIQIYQPKRTNPPIVASRGLQAHVMVPPQVESVLERSCYDCHSSATVWPWYSYVGPISWLVSDDVMTGRSHINFQDWEAQENPREAAEHLGLICEEIRKSDMPPLQYRIIHRKSVLTPDEINTVCTWSESFINPGETEAKPKGD